MAVTVGHGRINDSAYRWPALRLVEVAGRRQKDFRDYVARLPMPDGGRRQHSDGPDGESDTAREEYDGTAIVIIMVHLAVDPLVEIGTRGQHREQQHERNASSRKQAPKKGL
jgi:hypothetical protein